MRNKVQNIAKNYWALALSVMLALVGWAIKEYVFDTFYYAYAGTNIHAKVNGLLWLAQVHHEYLPNVHLNQYSSAWCSLIQLAVITVTYLSVQFGLKNKWIASVTCAYGCAAVLGIWAFTGNSANVIDSMILMVAFTVMYQLNMFNRHNALFLGLFTTGSLGNFIEGNVREYVIDYLWMLPSYSDQVHNLEDIMIWVGLFGAVVCFGIWFARVMMTCVVKINSKRAIKKATVKN